MAEVRVHYHWPNGVESSSYAPSNVVRKHVEADRAYTVTDFTQRMLTALDLASDRVRQHFGHRCSIADRDAQRLREEASVFDAQASVHVTELETIS